MQDPDALADLNGSIVGMIGIPVAGAVSWYLLGPPTNCGAVIGWVIVLPIVHVAWVLVATIPGVVIIGLIGHIGRPKDGS